MERRGLIELPAARPVNFAPSESAEPAARMQWLDIEGTLRALGKVELVLVNVEDPLSKASQILA